MALDVDPSRWHPETIPGRRVVLRRHRPDQYPTILRWYRDPEVARLTRFQVGPVSDDEVRRFFQARLVAADAFAYAIHQVEDERLIGTTTLSALDPDNGSVLFHITVGEHDCWGRGLGTEATELMVRHAFEVLGLHRVGLSVFEFNGRAIRAYEKAGFREEGRSREAVWRDGAFWDEIHMGILETEWRRRAGRTEARPGVTASLRYGRR
jgi:RimJ/RimL family protein N-acetyltransferase